MATTRLQDGNFGANAEDWSVILANKTDNSHMDPADNRDMNSEEVRLPHQLWQEGCVEVWPVAPHPTLRRILVGGNAKEDMAFVEGATGAGTYLVRRDLGATSIEMPAAHPTEIRLHNIYLVVFDRLYRNNTQNRTSATLAMVSQDTAGETLTPDSSWSGSILIATVSQRAASTSFTQNDITVYPRVGQTVSGVTGPVTPFNDPVQPLARPVFALSREDIFDFAHPHTLADIPNPAQSGSLFIWNNSWGGNSNQHPESILPLTGNSNTPAGSRRRVSDTEMAAGTSGINTVSQFYDIWDAGRIVSVQVVVFSGSSYSPTNEVWNRRTDLGTSGSHSHFLVEMLNAPIMTPHLLVGTPRPSALTLNYLQLAGAGVGISQGTSIGWELVFDPVARDIRGRTSAGGTHNSSADLGAANMFTPSSTNTNRIRAIQVNVHYQSA